MYIAHCESSGGRVQQDRSLGTCRKYIFAPLDLWLRGSAASSLATESTCLCYWFPALLEHGGSRRETDAAGDSGGQMLERASDSSWLDHDGP